jgi:uncharacterized protein YndB with AHSA1/START domain
MKAEPVTPESIRLEVDLPEPPEKVWRAMSDAHLAGRWLDATDLRAEVGCRFRMRPADGSHDSPNVDCEIIEAVPNERLRWLQHERESATDTHVVESIVTLELSPTSHGTRLRIVHDGFRHVRTHVVALASTRQRRKAKVTGSMQSLRLAA